ncbi:fatty acid synthase subunit beta [Apiospora marii]|uniref:Fatty acid synthase subunit beta n=1 Tax=Apiospora marii TaxID=335849 RepID=A0ABR1SHV8_9PEZI
MACSDEATSSFAEVHQGTKIFDTPGLFTPVMHGNNLTVFRFSHHSVHVGFQLAPSDVSQLSSYLNTFLASLEQTGDGSDGKPPSSDVGLAFRFLNHLLANQCPPDTLARLFYACHTEIDYTHIHAPHIDAVLSLPLAPSALLVGAREKKNRILVAFGGQSSANPDCVEDLAALYSLYRPFLEPLVTSLGDVLGALCRHQDTRALYLGREIDLPAWLEDPASRPSRSFLASAAVSFPMIDAGQDPGDLGQSLAGATGHSQGIVLAAVAAKAHDWESFFVEAKWAVQLLFWIGFESQMAAPPSLVTPAIVRDSLEGGEGAPSHMLLVRGLGKEALDAVIAAGNRHLPVDERLYLSLINSPTDHVVAGPPRSLRGLVLRLREVRARDGLDQSRIPYSSRRPVIDLTFLPVNAPFHTPYLQEAAIRIATRMSKSWPVAAKIKSLQIPVFDTGNGRDWRASHETEADVAQLLIDAVTTRVVDWPNTLQVHNSGVPFTHVITLGVGRFAGMVYQNVDGRGVRVIDGTRLDAADLNTMGDKVEIFAPAATAMSTGAVSWEEQYRPRLTRSADGSRYNVTTRLSQVLKAPPIIVAGMTPTTVPWDFVASVTQAGYHIELAGGGYHSPAAMTAALEKLAASIPAGRSITCNLIYVDPKAIGYQIPLIRQLIGRGVPIRGLTIGAGVPSPEVAAQYIETLGLEHIAFKPGSAPAIRDVAKIARAHPGFPVILQWTGGRGGGHHSCEDFHQPLLETYGEIRRCPNLYLVVGSGFGDGAGMLPYLTGAWSVPFGRPAMPCDGILLGSRMMVATDAHTSSAVKGLLLRAPGVDDAQWEESYRNSADAAGGVLTVTSEMGQPIHKVATRGVRLWKDMDDTVFSLPKAERQPALLKRKPEIIRRLNAEFAKPWFGESAEGRPVDLEDMTYAQVLSRLVKLMYVRHQKRWIDPSYRDLVAEFATRALERLGCSEALELSTLLAEPERLVAGVTNICPGAAEQFLHPEDIRLFMQSCKKRGRKPVNFVVALDDDFEHWFKKDSLWQSEDLEAVIDQDPERVCILQSPVSVRYSTRDDQTSKEILDEIHGDLAVLMMRGSEMARSADTPTPEETLARPAHAIPEGIIVDDIEGCTAFRPVPGQDLPSPEAWMGCLKSHACAAIVALAQQETVFEVAAGRRRENPFRHIFAARHGYTLVLGPGLDQAALRDNATEQTVLRVKADQDSSSSSSSGRRLHVTFMHSDAVPAGPAILALEWEFDEHVMELIDSTPGRDKRVQDFYAHLWLGQKGARIGRVTDKFVAADEFKLTRDLQRALCSAVSHALPGSPGTVQAEVLPLEAAVIAAWDVLMRPLLVGELGGDLLRLVHQSISIEYVSGASAMRVDESVTTESSVRAIAVQSSGKAVTVEAKLRRQGRHIATVTSEFFIKGKFADDRNTFRHRQEPTMELEVGSKIDEAVLRDCPWVHLDDPSMPLVGETLVFDVQTRSKWTSSSQTNAAPGLEVRGTIEHLLWNGSRRTVGSVRFDAPASQGNPSPGWAAESQVAVVVPANSRLYAEVSGDCNPIHLSPVFAHLAGLPGGPIMHGMYTAAVCRQVVEDLAVAGEPHRLRRFEAAFVGMVRASDRLVVGLSHVAMHGGRMVLEVVARLEDSGETVLRGEAEIDQPSTAYLFTGQGSQSPGMGMALYETSPAARALYDEMDSYFIDTYGWSILRVIRENPKELTIHFRGRQGQRILGNYLDMQTEVLGSDGTRHLMPIIPGLGRHSASHTFADPRGLLQSTLFAQPAIILVERATFAHLRERGLVQEGAVFAGHSLGEYGALSSLTDFVSLRDMLSIAIYRGLTMQLAIPRDLEGHTGYSMVAANPSRVGKYFDDKALRHIVRYIHQESGELLEIVNFNVEGDQYVCAGHVRNLHCLGEILDATAAQDKVKPAWVQEFVDAARPGETALGRALAENITRARGLSPGITLQRGRATIPLAGIDVPFHSSRLQPGVPAMRDFLRARVRPEGVRPDRLVGRYIPNVVGRPFSPRRGFH